MLKVDVDGKATIYAGKRVNDFSPTNIKVGKMKVYKDKSKKIMNILEENEKEIKKIGEQYHAEALIIASNRFFRYVVSTTQEYEIDINILISKDRKMIHYTSFGFEPTVLLIALDD